MKNILIILSIFMLSFFTTEIVSAHSGNTDSSGCHTCRTNCTSYGLSYGQYHCHTPKYSTPSYTPSIPTCPSNSYYDGISSCKCNYGYVVSGSSCVSGNSLCYSQLGYSSSYDSLSKTCKCDYGYYISSGSCVSDDKLCQNQLGYSSSYDSISDMCECNYGYVIGSSGKCISASSYCSDQLGLMSRYNSLSKKCECMSGYEFDGLSCKYKINSYSYPENSSRCPVNAHASISDSTKCQCDIGYESNQTKDSCIKKPIKTNNQICQDSFGMNVSWDGTKTVDNKLNCNCKTGYEWNTGRTACIKSSNLPSSSEANEDNIPVPEGAVIKSANNPDIYIVKYVGTKKFKRLVLSPSVFNNYGHLKWENVMIVSQAELNSFTTSELVRAVGDTKIYRLYPQGDSGQKRLLKDDSVLTRLGLDPDSIYEINLFDRESYITGVILE